jgi:hypothetical protein
VTVDVRLGTRLGPGRRSMRLPAGATVADLIAALAPDLGRSPDELAGVAVATATATGASASCATARRSR